MRNKIKDITLITIGNPMYLETWSGVPYFLLKELQSKGYNVNVIDLEPNRYIKIIYNIIVLPIISLFIKRGELSIYRSIFFLIYQHYVLKKKLYYFKNVDIIIGLSYNIMPPKASIPVLLFSDWPFLYKLKREGVELNWYHKFYTNREIKCMRNASRVISLFPTCANYINKVLGEEKAISLGINVVNNFSSEPRELLVSQKVKTRRIVFIGRSHYLQGAIALILSYVELKNIFPEIVIDIIGITKDDILQCGIKLNAVDNINFWGYLDKGDIEQCKIYYNILRNASLYVNTSNGWVGYTSMVEAMYYYTPVVVSPVPEFLEEFGEDIDFGVYCHSSEELVGIIKTIFSNEEKFDKLCKNAHKRVSEYTWSNFIDRLLDCVKL